MSDDQKVGFKKPPRHSRFAKGKSGNAGGRPKARSADLDDDVIAIAETKTANGKTVRQLMVGRVAKDGVDGDFGCIKWFIEKYELALRRRGRTAKDDLADEKIAREYFGTDHPIFHEAADGETPQEIYKPSEGSASIAGEGSLADD